MPIRMPVPPGNKQIRMYDGTLLKADRGYVTVEEPAHARAINSMGGNGTAGLLNASFAVYGGNKRAGRWCKSCQPARLWNAWNLTCSRCGAATEPE